MSNIREKQWFASLLETYGLCMIVDRDTSSLAYDALVDSDGWPTDGLRELVDNVVAYQRGTAASAVTDVWSLWISSRASARARRAPRHTA